MVVVVVERNSITLTIITITKRNKTTMMIKAIKRQRRGYVLTSKMMSTIKQGITERLQKSKELKLKIFTSYIN